MTENLVRVVVDTSILVSAAVWPNSRPAEAVRYALLNNQVLTSFSVEAECRGVFSRTKFDAYASVASRMRFLELFFEAALTIEITHAVYDCRDPKDNMFLELAAAGKADFIITGDKDLLALHPWRGVSILTPSSFLFEQVPTSDRD